MRILEGITFRSREMTMLQQVRMTVTEMPMPIPLKSVVVIRHGGAHAQQLYQHRVLGNEPFFELLFHIHDVSPPP